MIKARLTLTVTLGLSLFFSSLAANVQQTGKVRRIGFLSAPSKSAANVDSFRQGLRERAYVEGQNLLVEWRFAEGRYDQLPSLAADLVMLKVELIVTFGTPAALAAKKATTSIPIVFTAVSDPVGSGLVPSLARPGGNVTGFTHIAVDLTGKRLELLKEAVPSLKSVALLTDPPPSPNSVLVINEVQIAARKLGLEVRLVEVRHPAELEPALTTIAHTRAEALVLVPGSFAFTHRLRIVELATKRRLPVLGWERSLAESGALLSYGASTPDILRRAGGYVDKILNGAWPADLPVEQSTKFELVISTKTAKALGLTIPQSLLLRADHVIE